MMFTILELKLNHTTVITQNTNPLVLQRTEQVRVLNVCTSCWEKTGGLLFSSCTVTTTVQELFRPAKNIIGPSVSDSRSTSHQENDVC